ncbi:MAG: RNA polymerase sigma-70 factor [Bacteroidota bacterium]|nr:RNA polymerase sigma-70 factor [Bacteroidota bacterium]
MNLHSASDSTEFDQLFRLHYKFMCNVANRILHDREAAEDVVQEIFAKLWTKKTEIPPLQSGKNFLFRVTVNATLDHLEKNKRIVRLVNEDHLGGSANETEEKLELKELELKISKTLEALSPKCRAVFILSRYEGMKYREIADHLDISVKTVENHMGKALAHMREKLLPQLGNDHLTIGAITLLATFFNYWLPIINF